MRIARVLLRRSNIGEIPQRLIHSETIIFAESAHPRGKLAADMMLKNARQPRPSRAQSPPTCRYRDIPARDNFRLGARERFRPTAPGRCDRAESFHPGAVFDRYFRVGVEPGVTRAVRCDLAGDAARTSAEVVRSGSRLP
jgi:hypothetical protein